MKNYLDVEEGKNGWKRYLSTTILASAFMLLGSIIYIIADMVIVAADESGKSYFDFDSGVAVGINANLDFLLFAMIVGLMFSIGHFANPEMNKSIILVGLDYIVAGFALTYIAIKTKSLEITIGAHAANNMFLALFLTTDDSVFGSIPSLFKAANTEPGANLIWSIVMFSVFYILCRGKIKKEEAADKDQLIA
jgi:hypothetical protein